MSVDDVMRRLSYARSTVTEHLATYIQLEKPASIAMWVSQDVQDRVTTVVRQIGGERLKPIFLALGEKVPYDDIRLVLAYLKTRGHGELRSVSKTSRGLQATRVAHFRSLALPAGLRSSQQPADRPHQRVQQLIRQQADEGRGPDEQGHAPAEGKAAGLILGRRRLAGRLVAPVGSCCMVVAGRAAGCVIALSLLNLASGPVGSPSRAPDPMADVQVDDE